MSSKREALFGGIVDPRVLFKIMVYGYQRGIYSSRKLEEALRR